MSGDFNHILWSVLCGGLRLKKEFVVRTRYSIRGMEGMEGWRWREEGGGMEGWRDGGMEGWRDGGMEGWREGGNERMKGSEGQRD